MIVCKLGSVYHVPLPPFVLMVLEAFDSILSLGIDLILVPLECLGLRGYVATLVFWMCLWPTIFGLLCLGRYIGLRGKSVGQGNSRNSSSGAASERLASRDYAEWVVSMGARTLFLFYPVISTVAFEAFACYDFGREGRWLIVDVSISCDASSYKSSNYIFVILTPDERIRRAPGLFLG